MNLFDLHCDTPYECYTKSQGFYVNRLSVSGSMGEAFGVWKQVFAVWIKDDLPLPFKFYKEVLCDFKAKLTSAPENLSPIFAVEGGAVLENDADRLFTLYNDGVRLLTLTWNGENNIGGGTLSEKGLTPFGKTVIENLNRLNMGCDLSHLNQKTFYSAIEHARYPLATHSNCFSVCRHPRNLTDEQIKLLCEKGGIIGLCFYPPFLGKDVFLKIYQNIFHLCEMGFENNIAIGSDFDGGRMDKRLNSILKIADLYDFLREKGLALKLLNKIFYENADNFIAILSKKV